MFAQPMSSPMMKRMFGFFSGMRVPPCYQGGCGTRMLGKAEAGSPWDLSRIQRAQLRVRPASRPPSGPQLEVVRCGPVSISDGATGWFGLGPIAILPQHQRRGIGSRLVRAALRLLRSRGACGCVVLGEPHYYRRFGFQADPGLILPGVPPEYFLALSFDSSQPRGTVTYHEAFNAQA